MTDMIQTYKNKFNTKINYYEKFLTKNQNAATTEFP